MLPSILFFLFIKLSGMQVTTETKEPIETASFVLGKVEDSENSEGYGVKGVKSTFDH